MKYNGTSWNYVGTPGFSAGKADYLTFAFSPAGEPYVAYIDSVYSLRASVMKFNGSAWVYVGTPGFTPDMVGWPSLAINPVDGQPYLVFNDNAAGTSASVMKFNGTNWVYVGKPGFSPGTMLNTSSIAFSPLNHQPYVAFEDSRYGSTLCCWTYKDTAWVYAGNAGFTNYSASDVSLAFSQNGVLYAGFREGPGTRKASVMKLSGNLWEYVGQKQFSQEAANEIQLAINPKDGLPYFVYDDSRVDYKLSVFSYDGSNWVPVGNTGFTPGFAQHPSIAFNSLGQAFVGFSDIANNSKASVMYYAP